MVAHWWTHLAPAITGICQGAAEQMAAYRLFKCSRVTLSAVLAPHRRLTVARVAVAFARDEWTVIAVLATGQCPTTEPTVACVVRWLALLGGFAGRQADGPPGPTVLTRGWLRVQEAIRLQRLLTKAAVKCV